MARDYDPLVVNPNLVSELRILQRGQLDPDSARKRLGNLLSAALHLEFSTIPPYLSAAFSLGSNNGQIYQLILRVAKEEMLHMTVVANLMNAIGTAPDIRGAVPAYPFDLTVVEPPLRLDLKSFSYELLEDLFMQIESPEEPIDFPVAFAVEEESIETIGQFYDKIIKLIEHDTIPGLFANSERDHYKQITVDPNFGPIAYLSDTESHDYPLPTDIDFIIKDKATALLHLNWIVEQGEGATPFDPLAPAGIPAHFYRFESVVKGRYLIKDETVEKGYSFTGGSLPFTENGASTFRPNVKAAEFEDHRILKMLMDRFNKGYSRMIENLQVAFNCESPEDEPEAKQAYQNSLSEMRAMTNAASAIIGTANNDGVLAGIPFEFIPQDESPAIS